MKLSICMMVKNESKRLEDCLKSLELLRSSLESELIIVDTGSTDNTVSIAKKYTDLVYFHKWNDSFSEMRNVTISYAKGDWIFIIDADEVLRDGEKLSSFIMSNESKKFNTIMMWVNNVTANDSFVSEDFARTRILQARVFRNEGFRYQGAVHNQPISKEPNCRVECNIIHYGYLSTDKELMERKFVRTTTLIKKELEKDPNSIYFLYQLASSYGMYGELTKAIELVERAYNLVNKLEKSQRKAFIYVYHLLSNMSIRTENFEKSEKVCSEALELYPDNVDMYMFIAKSQMMQDKKVEAIESYQKYLFHVKNFDSIKRNEYFHQETLGKTELAYADLSVLYLQVDEIKKSLEYYNMVKEPELLKMIQKHNVLLRVMLRDFNLVVSLIEDNKELKDFLKYWFELNQNALQKDIITELSKIYFSNTDNSNENYTILQTVWRYMDNLQGEKPDIESFDSIDFASSNDYYGDVFYYLLKEKIPIYKYTEGLSDDKINEYFEYLIEKEDLSTIIYDYLISINVKKSFEVIRVNRLLSRYSLIINALSYEKHKVLFKKYLGYGIDYLESVYQSRILDNELTYVVKNEEEGFLIFMMHALKNELINPKNFINYIKKALKCYPLMKRGVQYYIDEIENNSGNKAKISFDENALKVKQTIYSMIENGQLLEAKNLIDDYEKIINNDYEIFSAKGIINILEGDFNGAKIEILKGLEIKNDDHDLLYNLAFAYEESMEYEEALNNYKKAFEVRIENKEELEATIKRLEMLI